MSIIRLLAVIFILAGTTSAQALETEHSRTFTYSLLTDPAPGMITMGAKTVAHDKAFQQNTTDIIAELLIERTGKRSVTGRDLDTTCWLIRALGLSENTRYKTVIENTISTFANEKVSKFGSLALAQLMKHADTQYVAGTISLEQLRKSLAAQRIAITTSTPSFQSLQVGQPIDDIFAVAGYPDEILETVETKGHAWVKIRTRSLQFHYFGLGLIDVDYSTSTEPRGWHVATLWPDVPNKASPYTGNNPREARLVMTTEPMQLQKLSGRLVGKRVTEVELLDRVAERIRVSLKSKEPHDIYALTYFCRLLGDSGNARYTGILQLVAKDATDSGMRKHANASLKRLAKN